jgi:hypothetical protein
MNETAGSTAPLRRWRKRLVVAVLLLPVGGWGYEIARQQTAIARGARLGIEAQYEGATVDGIGFVRSSPFGDDDWGALAAFRSIERLDLTFTRVTNRSLNNLENFPRLTSLSVLMHQITPEQELRLLAERPQLVIEKLHLIDGRRVVDGYQ